MNKSQPVYILTGTAKEFHDFVGNTTLPPSMCRRIDQYEHVLGLCYITILLYGTFYTHPLYQSTEFHERARICGIKFMEIDR